MISYFFVKIMTTEELEEKLEAGVETQTLDFKRAIDWNVDCLAKDILALSNVQDGGYVIIGVDDGTFQRQGVSVQQKETYEIDIMKDQMAAFADPHVNFTVDFPQDRNGLIYVVIKVFPFEEIPVICRKNGRDAKAGVLYYRNKNRRVESAAISNSYDMRGVIELAAIKMMQRKVGVGFMIRGSVKQKMDEEIKGL